MVGRTAALLLALLAEGAHAFSRPHTFAARLNVGGRAHSHAALRVMSAPRARHARAGRGAAQLACVSVDPEIEQRKNRDLYEGLYDPTSDSGAQIGRAVKPEVLSPAGGWPQLR